MWGTFVRVGAHAGERDGVAEIFSRKLCLTTSAGRRHDGAEAGPTKFLARNYGWPQVRAAGLLFPSREIFQQKNTCDHKTVFDFNRLKCFIESR